MNIADNLGLKKNNAIGLTVVMLAVLYGFIGFIIDLCKNGMVHPELDIPILIVYALIFYFVIFGYKVPNGKMLKYVFLIFALKLGIFAGQYAVLKFNICFILTICSAIIVAFVGGRLPKIKENKVNCAVILVFLLASAISRIVDGASFSVILLNHFIQGLALTAAYLARAQQYKENSGILDDK